MNINIMDEISIRYFLKKKKYQILHQFYNIINRKIGIQNNKLIKKLIFKIKEIYFLSWMKYNNLKEIYQKKYNKIYIRIIKYYNT